MALRPYGRAPASPPRGADASDRGARTRPERPSPRRGAGGDGRLDGLELVLPATPDAPAAARRSLERLLQLDEPTRETLTLLISEVVTNAVRHAGLAPLDPIQLTISLAPVIHVEVTDGGPGFDPGAVPRGRPDSGGWGLQILERLASRWGVDPAVAGRVWFELTP
jgi:anti-sigma regulatory factor (Ser/Thr protein kinase)